MIKKIESTNLIDRKTASKMLKTSMRTIDRYRQKGMLSTAIMENKIYLKKKEIEDFINRHSRQSEKTFVSIDSSRDSRDKNVDNVENDNIGDVGKKDDVKTQFHQHDRELDLVEYYKKMYEEISGELREKQSKLEGANYRVGQLESQLRWSVPLIEHQQETKKLLLDGEHFKKVAAGQEEMAKKAGKNFYIERLNKRIYLGLVLALILLQPLWLFLAK